ncbi:capsular polysaccharide biosynthesis protein [Aquitalea aquatica]|uniref:Capsular polysaccharide biosynthesis protein n=1 Tax=Aquitalea aquatica TaxID=3044273 RepID=A0A838XXP7_9NEIS|nr:capsular polysaccharide biosynthesis protein [Aquitalea magnusonii]MBA4707393.1 capsular polysaccharide biosynthesis protein [Aquitalea magnusonii]
MSQNTYRCGDDIAIHSRQLFNLPGLEILLQSPCHWHPLGSNYNQTYRIWAGWGYKPATKPLRQHAHCHGGLYLALEDGFIRSLGLGVQGHPPLSIVVDDLGIYYDASQPSRLEVLIRQLIADGESTAEPARQVVAQALLDDAGRGIDLLMAYRLSKYNHAPDFVPPAGWQHDAVLVVDQTVGDMSVRYGNADADTFRQMLRAAVQENPTKQIWVKTHPDVLCGKKQGYLTRLVGMEERVQLLGVDANPLTLLPHVSQVYTVCSQLGFEALLCGKPVITFGQPWYAGWGLSDDRHPLATSLAVRRGTATLPQLFAAAYLQYCRYVNPSTGDIGTLFDVIHHLQRQKVINDRLRGELVCIGMSWWKRAVLSPFLRQPSCTVRFVRSAKALERLPVQPMRKIATWGSGQADLLHLAHERGWPLLRIEDGFIRSVGLGSNLTQPLSLVLDDEGIYFDPRQPSRLETLLATKQFEDMDLVEAEALHAQLIRTGLGKYNIGQGALPLPQPRPTAVVLVVGQVEDDASICTGSPWIKTNLDLLKAVRRARPAAFIVYKPHPDVVSGNRIGSIAAKDSDGLADMVTTQCDIHLCLQQVDEVHTMTSLTGFEALLRGKHVVCYGLPFYAGWGLTEDVFAHAPLASGATHPAWERRSRRLILKELIAASLLLYPCYIDPISGNAISASQAATLLACQKADKTTTRLHGHSLSKQLGKLRMLWRCIRR